jgi:hypothetical protein
MKFLAPSLPPSTSSTISYPKTMIHIGEQSRALSSCDPGYLDIGFPLNSTNKDAKTTLAKPSINKFTWPSSAMTEISQSSCFNKYVHLSTLTRVVHRVSTLSLSSVHCCCNKKNYYSSIIAPGFRREMSNSVMRRRPDSSAGA